MLDGILDAAFLQAACAHVAPEPPEQNVIMIEFFDDSYSDLSKLTMSGTGTIKIEYNGQTLTYNSPSNEPLGITPEEGAIATIIGDITELKLNDSNLYLKTVDISQCATIANFEIATVALNVLKIGASLETIQIPQLRIINIYYPANKQQVYYKIAQIIEDDTVRPGTSTLYTDTNGEYYSVLAAAVAEQTRWTIQQLS